MTIHELAQIPQNATDKQNGDHTFHGRNYLHHYEKHFEALRNCPVKVLEIGVFGGWSLRLWRDYFPLGDIHGLDINPDSQCQEASRITVHIGDQGDYRTLEKLALEQWDIVIDDGSHYVPHILLGFSWLWPTIRSGGFYVMEDMRISYHDVDMDWPGMLFNQPLGSNHRVEVDALLSQRLKAMDNVEGDIAAIHLYPMIYFFEKV